MPVRGRIAIDLTLPIDPETRVTGASLPVRFVASLVQHVQDVEFLIVSREEQTDIQVLPALRAPNARHVILGEPGRLQTLWRRGLGRIERSRRGHVLSRVMRSAVAWSVKVHADVVLCPYTLNGWVAPMPLVVAIDDVQHLSHPFLVSANQRRYRAQNFASTLMRASRLLCSNETVRTAVLGASSLPGQRVVTLSPVPLLVNGSTFATTLTGEFVLVYTELQPRSNDRLLLTAIGMHRATHTDCGLRFLLACTHASQAAWIRSAAETMRLASALPVVVLEGAAEAARLVERCRALVVPCLYERVDDAVLHAVAAARTVPILRAGATFDPHNPADLAGCLSRFESDPHAFGRPTAAEQPPAPDVARAFVDLTLEAATMRV